MYLEHHIYAGDLTIDLWRGQALRDQQVINLTFVEFRLLVYLAQHANQAISRAQIVEAVWGYDPDLGSDGAINAHIRRLREKIEPNPSRPRFIQTVLGVGYRLDATRLEAAS